jgi:transposase
VILSKAFYLLKLLQRKKHSNKRKSRNRSPIPVKSNLLILSIILTDKYMDHLPLYRQKQRFARENIPIASSTLEGWVKQGLERIEPGCGNVGLLLF